MEKVIAILLVFILMLVLALLFGFPFMWLWNWIVPEVFGLKAITFWQGVAIQVLFGWLFRSSSNSNND